MSCFLTAISLSSSLSSDDEAAAIGDSNLGVIFYSLNRSLSAPFWILYKDEWLFIRPVIRSAALVGFPLFLYRPLLSGTRPLCCTDRPKIDDGSLFDFLTKLGWRSYSELLELFPAFLFFLFDEEDDEDEELEEDFFKSLLESDAMPC